MLVNRLLMSCSCGTYCSPCAFYVTEEKTLMVEGFCVKCTCLVQSHYPLAEMFSMSLQLSGLQLEAPAPETPKPALTDFDHKFLAQIHIKEDDDATEQH